ncbi:MAG: DUF3465 domain-containing protein [Gammaproteobacteria bacterium]|nr:DUF3465 domain-containing protein [Gammaproteobacteria bacterium]
MKKLVYIAVIASALVYGYSLKHGIPASELFESPGAADGVLANAYDNQRSDFQIEGKGVVIKLLSDDLKGSRHQRFILKLHSDQTLLIAHNIDLAPRVVGLKEGDAVEFYGEYEWNSKGGVIHWTHHDPDGNHPAGWLKHDGRTYQ